MYILNFDYEILIVLDITSTSSTFNSGSSLCFTVLTDFSSSFRIKNTNTRRSFTVFYSKIAKYISKFKVYGHTYSGSTMSIQLLRLLFDKTFTFKKTSNNPKIKFICQLYYHYYYFLGYL